MTDESRADHINHQSYCHRFWHVEKKKQVMIKDFFAWMLYKILCWLCPEEMTEQELDEHEKMLGE